MKIRRVEGQRAIGVELCKIGNGDVERTARTFLLEKIADTLFSESDEDGKELLRNFAKGLRWI